MPLASNPYRRTWAQWLPAALPLLEAENYHEALKDFPKPAPAELSFRQAGRPRKLAFITTAGAYDSRTQAPFVETSAVGDVTHRVFASDLPSEAIAFRHGHYDPASVVADREVLLPRRALAAAGMPLTKHIVSTMGYCIDWPTLIEATIPAIVAQVRADEADGALLVPV